ncbi:hypothetical protein HA402_004926 [Bradysia odoriphaga]|nr:hypothetical protein HA402_004926 [Bradysia odoriphaga]
MISLDGYCWLLLALATVNVHGEKCLFSADDLTKIRSNEMVTIESKDVMVFIKDNPNELAVLNFISNNRQRIHIDDNYKFSLERIINFNGIANMDSATKLNQLVHESDEPHHAISAHIRQRVVKISGRVMLVHGIYGTIVTCSHQILSTNCALSSSGLTTSLVLAKLEPIAIAKLAPKIVSMTSRIGTVIGKFMPKVQFAIRLVGTKAAIKLLEVGGAALGGVFDVFDIAMNAKILVDCNTNGGCSDRDVRDSIVSMSISGVSFVAGIAFAALAMPGVGLVVSAVLMVGQLFYTAFSNVFEYRDKYHLTFGESTTYFFRSLVFLGPTEQVQMLAKRTEYINFSANQMWETLDNYTDTVRGFGIGLGHISIHNNDVTPSRSVIDLTSQASRTLARVIPSSVNDNVEMICLPDFKDEDYENGVKSYHQSAVYYCDNAMVFIHKGRPKANTVVYNLQYVKNGDVKGSNEWNNVFQITKANEAVKLYGGKSVTNHFIFVDSPVSKSFHFSGGVDATNLIDMTNVERTPEILFTYGKKTFAMVQIPEGDSPSMLVDVFDPAEDKRIYHYLARSHSPNVVKCLSDSASFDFLLLHTGGGNQDTHDTIIDCPRVVLSPFTTYMSSEMSPPKIILDVQTKGYEGEDLVSHINVGTGEIHLLFNQFELTSKDTTMSYNHAERTMTIAVKFQYTMEQANKFQLLIHGYDLTQLSFRLFNRNQHMIVPRIPEIGDDTDPAAPIPYEVFAMCSQASYQNLITNNDDECIAKTISLYQDLPLLITVQFNDSQHHDSLIVGSPHSDIIRFTDHIKFGSGRNGNDMYSVKTDIDNALVILNYADDNALDFVAMQTEIPRALTRQNNSLVVGNVEVRDFFVSLQYQHIVFIDGDLKQYFPVTSTYEMTPFLGATLQQNAFFLDASFNYSHIVLHNGNDDADYEMYRDNDDLLIVQQRSDNISCVITIGNFYMEPDIWSNVTWMMYYDNGTLTERYGFIFDRFNDIIDYKTKLQQDYGGIFAETRFTAGISVALMGNLGTGNEDPDSDAFHINVIKIYESISAQNIEVKEEKDGNGMTQLVLTDKQSDAQFRIMNWGFKPNRISIIALPTNVEHFEPVTIRGLGRFDSNQAVEIQSLVHLAAENYDLLPSTTPLTMVGAKCIISNATLSGGEVGSFKCLGFQSLDEQVKFVNKYCVPDTYDSFKTGTTVSQIRTTVKFLRNNIVLQHVFENSENDACEAVLLKVYASDFVVNPNKLDLFTAIDDINKFKEMIESGADPRQLTDDEFHRNVLHMAAISENFELIKFIVERRLVDINAYDSEDLSALHIVLNRVYSRCGTDIIDKSCFNRSDVVDLLNIADYLLSKSATVKTPLKVATVVDLICTYVCDKYPNIQRFGDGFH